MSRSSLSRRAFLGAAGAGFATLATGAARRPNIVVVLADDLGFADLGFQGARDIPTPNLDRLCAGGVRFTNGYVSHPFCSPSRAGLMTGRYQQRFGYENNPKYNPRDEVSGLPVNQVMLPQMLANAGYRTGIVGKWHLGAAPTFHPLRRGFQEQFGFIGGGHDYFRANAPGEEREYFIPLERNGKPVEEKEYLTDAFSREAVSFVERNAKSPFFLYLAYNAPHTPQQVSEKYLDKFRGIQDERRRLYAAMTNAVDDGVGRLLGALRDLKLDSDTLVFFLSDNGGPTQVNGSSNAPLRGAKGQVYEGGIRVPFAARWPGRLPAGKLYHQPVISLDIFPTAAALAGAKPPAGLDGVDLLPYLTGKGGAPHRRLFWRTGGGVSYALREGRYKLVRAGDGAPELYDLESDIGESKNIAAAKPELVKELDAAREQWDAQLVPPLFEGLQKGQQKKRKG